QLSRRIFFDFSTFNPKIFRFFKFRAGNFPDRELSGRKKPGGKNFRPAVPGAIGRAGFGGGWGAPSVECRLYGYFSCFVVIYREFFESGNFRAGKFSPFYRHSLTLPLSFSLLCP
ncbi:MAG: hypothetical protein WCX63_05065, partial [Methanoregula sp.]